MRDIHVFSVKKPRNVEVLFSDVKDVVQVGDWVLWVQRIELDKFWPGINVE
jgi:hypothetical protein